MDNQLVLFDFPGKVILFNLVPKNQRIEIICKNCSSIWTLIKLRKSWDGIEEYLLRNNGVNRIEYWVRLENDNNFWIERWWPATTQETEAKRRAEHVQMLEDKGIYARKNKTC